MPLSRQPIDAGALMQRWPRCRKWRPSPPCGRRPRDRRAGPGAEGHRADRIDGSEGSRRLGSRSGSISATARRCPRAVSRSSRKHLPVAAISRPARRFSVRIGISGLCRRCRQSICASPASPIFRSSRRSQLIVATIDGGFEGACMGASPTIGVDSCSPRRVRRGPRGGGGGDQQAPPGHPRVLERRGHRATSQERVHLLPPDLRRAVDDDRGVLVSAGRDAADRVGEPAARRDRGAARARVRAAADRATLLWESALLVGIGGAAVAAARRAARDAARPILRRMPGFPPGCISSSSSRARWRCTRRCSPRRR